MVMASRQAMPRTPPSFLEKLKRADDHINAVNAEAWEFKRAHPGRIVAKMQDNGLDYLLQFRGPQQLPPRLSVIYGDAMQNLRSALDHLAFHLAWIHKRRKPANPKAVSFPIWQNGTEAEYERSDKGGGAVQLTHPEVQAHIKALQPFQPGNGGKDSPLFKLNDLNNRDKHAAIVLATFSADQIVAVFPVNYGAFSITQTQIIPGPVRLVDKAVIGPVRPPLGSSISEMQMQGYMVADIAIEEKPWRPMEVFALFAEMWNFVMHEIVTPLRPFLGAHEKYLDEHASLFEHRLSILGAPDPTTGELPVFPVELDET